MSLGMAAEGRQRVDEMLTGLRQLSVSKDRKVAVGSGLLLGWIQLQDGSREDAIKTIRRAVALDPAQDRAWELLLSAVGMTQDTWDAKGLALAQKRVRHCKAVRTTVS